MRLIIRFIKFRANRSAHHCPADHFDMDPDSRSSKKISGSWAVTSKPTVMLLLDSLTSERHSTPGRVRGHRCSSGFVGARHRRPGRRPQIPIEVGSKDRRLTAGIANANDPRAIEASAAMAQRALVSFRIATDRSKVDIGLLSARLL